MQASLAFVSVVQRVLGDYSKSKAAYVDCINADTYLAQQ